MRHQDVGKKIEFSHVLISTRSCKVRMAKEYKRSVQNVSNFNIFLYGNYGNQANEIFIIRTTR